RSYEKLGAHLATENGVAGCRFAVWAPNAKQVSVIGDFNQWERGQAPLARVGSSGIWEGFLPNIGPGAVYKYAIDSQFNNYQVDKTDPFGFFFEHRPQTASVVVDLNDYMWNDGEYLKYRKDRNALGAPV